MPERLEGVTTLPAARPAVAGPDPMLPRPFRVVGRRRETADTVTLELVAVDTEPLGADRLRARPGQFNMLYAFGCGEIPISASGDPAAADRLVHTIRGVGAVSRRLAGLRDGALVGVRGPFGSPWPVAESRGRDVLIIAGGIGLAPLRPAILHLLAHRRDYGRIVILYGARRPEEMLFRSQLEGWRSRFDLSVEATVDHATGDWLGPVGVVTQLIERVRFDPVDTVAMICGPEVMMRFTARELEDRKVPREQIHVSLERNMECAVGLCGHCQLGPLVVCKEGPVFPWPRVEPLLRLREL